MLQGLLAEAAIPIYICVQTREQLLQWYIGAEEISMYNIVYSVEFTAINVMEKDVS